MKNARLEVRVSKALKELIVKEAQKDQRSYSDFVRVLIQKALKFKG